MENIGREDTLDMVIREGLLEEVTITLGLEG